MATFDQDVWLSRSNKKHAKNAKKRAQEHAAIKGLAVIVAWCTSKNFTVNFSKSSGGIIYTETKEIFVCSRVSPMQQLYLLLHECGHLLIGFKERHQRFGMGYTVSNSSALKRSYHHRLDILEEEFEAWHRGWKLGERLGVMSSENKVQFDRTRIRLLRSYLLWASKAPGYEKYDEPSGEREHKNEIVS